MSDIKASTCRMRLRVRFGKALTSDETSASFLFDNREVDMRGQERDQPLREAKWMVFSARGFENEAAAKDFGERLRSALNVAGVCTSNGIDTGNDKTTTWVSEEFARQIGAIKDEERIAPNVHGLSIHPDDDLTKFPVVSAEAVVTAQVDGLLEALQQLGLQPLRLGDAAVGLRLLNLAIMDNQPLARLVLALSAVEALAEGEKWTQSQADFIKILANDVEEGSGGDSEKLEIADAIRKSLFRLSIRQGVKRFLARIDRQDLLKDWDRLYGARSGIFHGTLVLPEPEIHQLANETVTLCGKIMLALAHTNGVAIPSIASNHYP